MIRIGTRESKLALWQAEQVRQQLDAHGYSAELVPIKSEGDIDLATPLYAMGVQGIFTRSLDIALLNKRIDVAVHSMKDVPTVLPGGVVQAAVLQRGPVNDLVVFKNELAQEMYEQMREAAAGAEEDFVVATSSIRRKAQWLHRFPQHQVENLRGNVITRLQKLKTEAWQAAIFAQAGLERIDMRPETSKVLDWMLPAPAQGAIMVACRENDNAVFGACRLINHQPTTICTRIEKDFLKTLLGGCSTPIAAFAEVQNGNILFRGNIFSLDGKQKAEVEQTYLASDWEQAGKIAANELLENGGRSIADAIRNDK